jgi:hypothetical protein
MLPSNRLPLRPSSLLPSPVHLSLLLPLHLSMHPSPPHPSLLRPPPLCPSPGLRPFPPHLLPRHPRLHLLLRPPPRLPRNKVSGGTALTWAGARAATATSRQPWSLKAAE